MCPFCTQVSGESRLEWAFCMYCYFGSCLVLCCCSCCCYHHQKQHFMVIDEKLCHLRWRTLALKWNKSQLCLPVPSRLVLRLDFSEKEGTVAHNSAGQGAAEEGEYMQSMSPVDRCVCLCVYVCMYVCMYIFSRRVHAINVDC